MHTETKRYNDGTIVTGTAPLPEISPREQNIADALRCVDDIEAFFIGGSHELTIRLRGLLRNLTF